MALTCFPRVQAFVQGRLVTASAYRLARASPLPSRRFKSSLLPPIDFPHSLNCPRNTFTWSKRASPAVRHAVRASSTKSMEGPEEEKDLSGAVQRLFAASMPKEEIQAADFIKRYPEYDGRGIRIAIFDTGIDPGAAGLQVTPDGQPKVVDIVDCTGSGDVDMKTIVKADESGYIVGATGRKLRVNPGWSNPTGEWRVGAKKAFELFPKPLVERVKRERRRWWDEQHREAISAVLRQLAEFDEANPKPVTDAGKKRAREDLAYRLQLLEKTAESYKDVGPILDCVVWHDGETLRAAIDTTDVMDGASPEGNEAGKDGAGSGLLADFTPLADYKRERKYATFRAEDACANFGVKMYEGGRVLSIVTDCGSHGTHVAGITGAYHPEEPSKNGLAPGVTLVSCMIGDARLSTLETGTGIVRGLIACLENDCDLINMSFGEPISHPDTGRVIELCNELVDNHGVVFVSSAGNSGPALSTVGAPGGTSSSIIGIGAYVSPTLAAAGHSLIEAPLEGMQYTWSSRGPAADGYLGVSLSAPGGAIAPVPQWTQQKSQFMNGTSMSSPNACGGIALVLSALKAQGKPRRPHLLRRALENTARSLGQLPVDTLMSGHGMVQVEKALDYLMRCNFAAPDVHFRTQVTHMAGGGSVVGRGLYLREPLETSSPVAAEVFVKPLLHRDAHTRDERAAFEETLRLESSAPSWLACPESLLLHHGGRPFGLRVDPTKLSEGLHYAEVRAIDMAAPWRGPVFRVPVTIIKPMVLDIPKSGPIVAFKELSFMPGDIERRFIAVPEGASAVEFTITMGALDTPRSYFVHALQLLPHRRYNFKELKSFVTLSSRQTKTLSMAVVPGTTLELVVAQFWSSGSGSSERATMDVEATFHGLLPLGAPAGAIHLEAAPGITRVDVRSAFHPETLSPQASLTSVCSYLRPEDSKLEPLSAERDMLPDGRQIHSLTLSYKMSLAEGGKVTVRVPLLNGLLYDSPYEAQLYMIFDSNKKLMGCGDTYPDGIQLAKGDYTILLNLRHDQVAQLEKQRSMVIVVERALDDKAAVKLTAYADIGSAITGGDGMKDCVVGAGEKKPLFLAAPGEDKLPKDVAGSVGCVLKGKATFGKLSVANGGYPASYVLTYNVPPATPKPKSEAAAAAAKPEEEKSLAEKMKEAVRDAKVKQLKDLPGSTDVLSDEYHQLVDALKAEYPGHLPLLSEVLRRVNESPKRPSLLAQVVAAADDVINNIDKDALARHFGACATKADEPSAEKLQTEMETRRNTLVDALVIKTTALLDVAKANLSAMAPPASNASPDSDPTASDAMTETKSGNVAIQDGAPGDAKLTTEQASAQLEETFAELKRWTDVNQAKYGMMVARREINAQRPGLALKALNAMLDGDDKKLCTKEVFEMKARLMEQLGWVHMSHNETKAAWEAFPASHPLF
eukprot:jgi/Mesvir1/27425/Mv25036-RA.1